MARWLSAAVKWLLKHPEVVQVVVDAIDTHAAKKADQKN